MGSLSGNDEKLLQHVYHEYDTLWAYYIKTHEERHNLYNIYFLIVGIPVSAIGVIIGLEIKSDIILAALPYMLFIISFIGFSLYLAYIITSNYASKYLRQINYIRRYVIATFDEKAEGLFNSIYKESVERYDKRNANRKRRFSLLKLMKGSTLPIVNSAIFVWALKLVNSNLNHVFTYFFMLLLQLALFAVMAYFSVYRDELMERKLGFQNIESPHV